MLQTYLTCTFLICFFWHATNVGVILFWHPYGEESDKYFDIQLTKKVHLFYHHLVIHSMVPVYKLVLHGYIYQYTIFCYSLIVTRTNMFVLSSPNNWELKFLYPIHNTINEEKIILNLSHKWKILPVIYYTINDESSSQRKMIWPLFEKIIKRRVRREIVRGRDCRR